MSKSIRWQEFEKLLVIRKLRDLVGQWWSIQMHFTDHKGLLKGVPSGKFFNPLNPISQAIVEDDRGFSSTMQDVKKTTLEASLTRKPKIVRNPSGFSALLVPLRIGRKSLGCVFADGFLIEESLAEQKQQLYSFLIKIFGIEKAEELYEHVDDLPVLSEKDLGYLSELIQVVVDEILAAQCDLSNAQKQVAQLEVALSHRYHFSNMIGKSSSMQNLYRMVEKVCHSTATVLVLGENGTGKELVARALHYNSQRKDRSLLVVNCGAFNDNLLESELFGHVKGAFTGAHQDKKGVFEAAHGGTLFLDEIGDTSLAMQTKLLRVLQEGTFRPVGSTKIKKTQVRLVAATNRNLEEMIQNNLFREDLYYRLNVILLRLPPLRERKEDIPLLVEHFLKKNSATEKSQKTKQLSQGCLEKLMSYSWPGNIRELQNQIERLCVLAGEETTIPEELLSENILTKSTASYVPSNIPLDQAVQEFEKELITSGLQRFQWRRQELAQSLGLELKDLEDKIKTYDLDPRAAS